jgi:hypothetical protein
MREFFRGNLTQSPVGADDLSGSSCFVRPQAALLGGAAVFRWNDLRGQPKHFAAESVSKRHRHAGH